MSDIENVLNLALQVAGKVIIEDKFATDSVKKMNIQRRFEAGVKAGYDEMVRIVDPIILKKKSCSVFSVAIAEGDFLRLLFKISKEQFDKLTPKKENEALAVAGGMGFSLGALITLARHALSAPVAWKGIIEKEGHTARAADLDLCLRAYADFIKHTGCDVDQLYLLFSQTLPVLFESRVGDDDWEDGYVRGENIAKRRKELLAWYSKTAKYFK